MAFQYTAQTLKDAIVAWLEDDGAEFAAALPQVIDLAERQVVKDLGYAIFDEVTDIDIINGMVQKPADLVSVGDFFTYLNYTGNLLQPLSNQLNGDPA